MPQWDSIIVGAGAAGCLLANRLSADPQHSVLLLEAGPTDGALSLRLPVGWASVAYGKRYNWNYISTPQPELNQRGILWPRGKVLGGSTATNGMVWVRGQAQDYDDWANNGADCWDWASVKPYFERVESSYLPSDSAVDPARPLPAAPSPWADAFIEACEAIGYPRNPEYNQGDHLGAGYFQQSVYGGWRRSSAAAFLDPVRARSNLTIQTGVEVHSLVVTDGVARGVTVRGKHGQLTQLSAKRIVLCAGSVGTPVLLQRSGIGDGERLTRLGVPVQLDQPAIGQNLQDHYGAMVAVEVSGGDTVKDRLSGLGALRELGKFLRNRTGLLAMPSADAFLFHPSEEALDGRPDCQVHFSYASGVHGDDGKSTMDALPGVTAITYPTRPKSRGYLAITGKHESDPVDIEPNYLTEIYDRRVLVSGLKTLRQVFGAGRFRDAVRSEIRPGVGCDSDDALLDYARQTGTTGYHPIGTCRMGCDKEAVVDTSLRLNGVSGVWVADASVMPTLISGNTMAATYMIAERAAEFMTQHDTNF